MNPEEKEPKVLYLACPFTHFLPEVMEHHYRTSCIAAAKLMKSGIVVFNPLSHSVPINEYLHGIEDQHSFWMGIDLPLLRRCDELLIIGLENWTESRGVKAEMFEAMAYALPITLIEEKHIDLLPRIPKTALHFLKSSIFTEVVDDE